jgi:predicted NAD/FAD-binding protein
MRIAIVGAGIAGNTAAYTLRAKHDVTVFEAAEYLGGHTHTVEVEYDGVDYAVDTGFIVFNDRTYPSFTALLEELGVESEPTSMSFSVSSELTGLEYNGTSLAALFAQRRNLFRPRFYRMLTDIVRFGRDAQSFLATNNDTATLADFLAANRYSRELVASYVVPMTAAIWSAPPGSVGAMPARFLLRFFANHGMLSIDRPQWNTIRGGSPRRQLVASRAHPHALRCAAVTPAAGRVVRTRPVGPKFSTPIPACHSDQALALLTDASPLEREVLGAIRYQTNDAVLHTDERLLPRRRRAWASWNYRVVGSTDGAPPLVTYHMNTLQRLTAPVEFCVTLNDAGRVAPGRVLGRYRYEHPVTIPPWPRKRVHAEIAEHVLCALLAQRFSRGRRRQRARRGRPFQREAQTCRAASTKGKLATAPEPVGTRFAIGCSCCMWISPSCRVCSRGAGSGRRRARRSRGFGERTTWATRASHSTRACGGLSRSGPGADRKDRSGCSRIHATSAMASIP